MSVIDDAVAPKRRVATAVITGVPEPKICSDCTWIVQIPHNA